MNNGKLIKEYLNASCDERLELMRFIKQYYSTQKRLPLNEGLESYPVSESIRKSYSVNFAPSIAGCPVCGK